MAYNLLERQSTVFGSGDDDGSGSSDSSGHNDDYSYYDDYDYYDGQSWWWTPVRCGHSLSYHDRIANEQQAGMAVRYAVVAILFAFLLIFFVGGYYHARRRLRKGLQPLAYHRWMVRRHMRPQQQHAYMPQQRYPQSQGYQNQGYQMDHYAPPPPAYNHADAPPPVYQPPEGGSKVMADQSYVYTQPLPQTPGHEAGESSQMHGARQ